MSRNRHLYRHISRSLMQLYPTRTLNGHQVRHLNTLAGMVSGIVQGKSCQLEKIARKTPASSQIESRIKRFARLTQHEGISPALFFLPFIMPLLQALASTGRLVLAIDGSETGRQCITLMVSVIYRKRAIPIAWLVKKGNKGHLSQAVHLELLQQVETIIPSGCEVIFLGDGEFDGTELQATLSQMGWFYVVRTAKNTMLHQADDCFSLKTVHLYCGEVVEWSDVKVTNHLYGPVSVIIWWHHLYEQPIYLLTNMPTLSEARLLYRRRARIETFFSDQKSRGFYLHKSHQALPERLARLLIPACLAYIWLIYLGVLVKDNLLIRRQIHRADRCDLSLFQLGIRFLEWLLDNGKPIPFAFVLPQ